MLGCCIKHVEMVSGEDCGVNSGVVTLMVMILVVVVLAVLVVMLMLVVVVLMVVMLMLMVVVVSPPSPAEPMSAAPNIQPSLLLSHPAHHSATCSYL